MYVFLQSGSVESLTMEAGFVLRDGFNAELKKTPFLVFCMARRSRLRRVFTQSMLLKVARYVLFTFDRRCLINHVALSSCKTLHNPLVDVSNVATIAAIPENMYLNCVQENDNEPGWLVLCIHGTFKCRYSSAPEFLNNRSMPVRFNCHWFCFIHISHFIFIVNRRNDWECTALWLQFRIHRLIRHDRHHNSPRNAW